MAPAALADWSPTDGNETWSIKTLDSARLMGLDWTHLDSVGVRISARGHISKPESPCQVVASVTGLNSTLVMGTHPELVRQPTATANWNLTRIVTGRMVLLELDCCIGIYESFRRLQNVFIRRLSRCSYPGVSQPGHERSSPRSEHRHDHYL